MIDDDEVTCFLHSNLLEEMDVSESILWVHDAEKALDYIQEGIKRQVYPDLILLDINMAGIDGFEFLESLRALEREEARKLNIVVLSASLNHRHKEIAASFEDLLKGYFLKPLDEVLVEKILRLIQHNEGSPEGKETLSPSDN